MSNRDSLGPECRGAADVMAPYASPMNTSPRSSIPEIASTSQNESVSPDPYLKFIDSALRLDAVGSRVPTTPHPSLMRGPKSGRLSRAPCTLHTLHPSPSSQSPTKRKHSPPPSISDSPLQTKTQTWRWRNSRSHRNKGRQ